MKAREVIATASSLAWGRLPVAVEDAREQFESLADEGNPRGQLGLGLMHATGIGFNVSIPRALVYLTFAALGGDDLAEMAMVRPGFKNIYSHMHRNDSSVAHLYAII